MEAGPAQRRHDGLIRVTAQGRGQSIAYDNMRYVWRPRPELRAQCAHEYSRAAGAADD